MTNGLLLFCSTLLLMFLPAVGHSQVAFDKETGHLTVKSEGRPLAGLLSQVSAKTGIEIYIAPGADRPVSLDIKALPVEDAIKEMIRPLNNVFVYRGNSSSIKTVKIYRASPAEATVRIAPLGASAARPDQKLPPSQAELENRARQQWEQRAAAQGMREDPERTKKREEREKKEESLKAERDQRMAEQLSGMRKRLEETHQRLGLSRPVIAAPENLPSSSAPAQ